MFHEKQANRTTFRFVHTISLVRIQSGDAEFAENGGNTGEEGRAQGKPMPGLKQSHCRGFPFCVAPALVASPGTQVSKIPSNCFDRRSQRAGIGGP